MASQLSIILASALVVLSASTLVMAGVGLGGGYESQQELGGLGHSEEIGGVAGAGVGSTGSAGGLGGLMGGFNGFDSLGSQFSGLLGGIGGAKKVEGELVEKKLAEKEAVKEGFLGTKGPVELVKLLLNPLELINKIAVFFKLEKLGLIELIGKGAQVGIEVALQPALLSIKIIEKVFVPDACKLKFACELGRPIGAFKQTVPKFSPGFLDGASTLKAFSDGILGHECEHLYPCGSELKLKKEFELLKNQGAMPGNKLGEIKGGSLNEAFNHGNGESEHFGGEHFAASNLSPSTVTKDAPLDASLGQ